MDTPQQEQDAPVPTVKFRSTKSRKTLRQRPQDHPSHGQQQQDQPRQKSPTSSSHASCDEAETSSVTAALRARMARKSRLAGVAFSTDSQADDHAVQMPAEGDATGENRLVASKGIPDRFMHQTGLVSTLNDKHMTDYIESRLSSRAASRPSHSHDAEDADTAMTAASSSDNRPRAVQPTRQGKIVEVDLSSQPLLPITGDESRKRKASTSLPPAPRWRNTRASDDVKRDQIVEAFLHENKLNVYDMPTRRSGKPGNGTRDGRSADDRMAEEFRRRFFDEMALRRQRKKPIPQTRQQKELREMRASEVLKGPKLGGSRNDRAAVRNILLNQEKEKLGRKI
ncbi:hypothetical protein E4U49_003283 [Claviceps purpurea]|nr:hypothetical protein E4U49_003283 [Claviceps purpurea]